MCGIAGIYAYHPDTDPVDREELIRIRDCMRARGPDAEGLWASADGRISLAHRRLAIIDLSSAANQPMVSTDGRMVISFNGEIYNYRTLKAELEAQGHVFRTNSDTEVLLVLYQVLGDKMFAKLRGMYAFALWDASKRALLLARDPYGIKPLYYSDDGRSLRTASQVKALLAGGRVSVEPSRAGMAGFYLMGSVPEPHTWVRSVRAVPAGSFIWVTQGGVGPAAHYEPVPELWANIEATAPGTNVQEEVRAALLEAVRDHLVADVPVGVFLSAGVDSGSLLSLMRDAGQREICAITIGFQEFSGQAEDEVPIAQDVARMYGAQHIVRRVTEKEFQADLPRILAAMDQPTIDGINTWFVAKAAREAGLKVAISGLGGDELFGGYTSFRDIPRWVSMLSLPSRIPGARPLFRSLARAMARVSPSLSPKIAGMAEFGGTYAGAYLLKRGLFMPWDLPSLMGKQAALEGLEQLGLLETIRQAVPARSGPHAKVASLESSFYMRNQLLRDSDWAGMAHSIEIRTPLVDIVLLRRLRSLVAAARAGKSLLWASPSRPLPVFLLQRAKTGFGTPIGRWLHGVRTDDPVPLANFGPQAHWSRAWARKVVDAAEFQPPSATSGLPAGAIRLRVRDRAPLRVLIFRIGSLGDTLVAVPTLKLVAAAFPNAERRLLSNLPGSSLEAASWTALEGMGLIHDYLAYPRLSSASQFVLLWRRIRKWRPDVIVYLGPRRKWLTVMRDRMFFRSLGARQFVVGKSLFDSHVNLQDPSTGLYEKEAARLLRNAAMLGTADLQSREVWSLSLDADDQAALGASTPGWDWSRPYLVFSAGTKMDAKDWGEDRWSELIKNLNMDAKGRALVAVGLEEERERSQRLLSNWSGPTLNLCGNLAPRLSATAIASADLFIGHDSGPMHMAGAANVPTVAIFSHRDQRGVWFPPGEKVEVLIKDVSCRGCMLQRCTVHEKQCIRSITVSETEAACHRALA